MGKWGVYLETGPRLRQFSERREISAIPLRVGPVPDVRCEGRSSGKGAWSSRSEGVAVEAEQSPRTGRSRLCWALLATRRVVCTAPSIPHYVKPAFAITNPSFLF